VRLKHLLRYGTAARIPNVRFMAQVEQQDDGCWIWMGPRVRTPSGAQYGSTTYGGRTIAAHRVAWMLFRGPVPPGLELDHLCRVTRCCNPLHLEPVTHRENVRRGMGEAGVNARKTHCIRGHEFTPENTIVQCGGKRACRACVNERRRERTSAAVIALHSRRPA
jgi:hypothetical protein